MEKIYIMIVEDNEFLREGIREMINQRDDMVVAGAYNKGIHCLAQLKEIEAELVLLDLRLKNGSLRTLKLIKKNHPDVKIIVMDLIPDQSEILEFIQAGASGFLLNDASEEEFVDTIHSVAEGNKILPLGLTSSLFSEIIEYDFKEKEKTSLNKYVQMTSREKEVIMLIADGLTNKEIADKMIIAVSTVKSHVSSILEKLNLHTRSQIVRHMYDSKSTGEEFDVTTDE